MPQLSRRVQLFTDSVIRRMTRISEQYDAINLSQGYPDFDPPRPLLDRLAQVAYEGPHQYSVTYGAQNLREALADKHSRATGRTVDPNAQVLVTCGGTEAMMAAVPGSSFFKEPVNHLIRMHFARGTDVLDEAVHRLAKLTELLKYSSLRFYRKSRN